MADKPTISFSPQPSRAFHKTQPDFSVKNTSVASFSSSSSFSASPSYHPVASNSTTHMSIATMETPTMKETKKVDITSLMSPPDPVLDSFHAEPHQNINIAKRAQPSAEKANQPAPLSPPVSPRTHAPHATSAERHPSIASQHNLKDPVLYPIEDTSSIILQPGSSQPPCLHLQRSRTTGES
ncbi:hypothetical protein V2G26_020428 [Clonostachys chloroleuca]